MLLKMLDNYHLLEINKNYIYDDMLYNNEIIEIKSEWKNLLNNNIPNILIYVKN